MSRAPRTPTSLLSIALLALLASAVGLAQEEEPREVELKKGLRYVDLIVGEGDEEVRRGKTVSVYYTGWLEDGTEFDSNRDGAALVVKVGDGRVIKGWEMGLIGMKEGGKRRLIVPPKLGYGKRGVQGRIPGNATLIFEIDVAAIF